MTHLAIDLFQTDPQTGTVETFTLFGVECEGVCLADGRWAIRGVETMTTDEYRRFRSMFGDDLTPAPALEPADLTELAPPRTYPEVRAVVDAVYQSGRTIRIGDGGPHCVSADDAYVELLAQDESRAEVWDGRAYVGFAFVVLGNAVGEALADYSMGMGRLVRGAIEAGR